MLTSIFILAASMQLYANQPCSLKTIQVQNGFETFKQQIYDPVPCSWSFKTGFASDNTTPQTHLDSIPQGADIIINGVVIAQTPATLILEQHYTQTPFIIFFRKDGYEGGSITVKSNFSGKVQLQPTAAQLAKHIPDYTPGDQDRVPEPPQSLSQPRASENTPFGFGSIRLGMSIAEFKAAGPVSVPMHPGMPHGAGSLSVEQTKCSPYLYGVGHRPVVGATICSHDLIFLNTPYNVEGTFVDGKLALITVKVASGMPPAGPGFRQKNPEFLPELVSEIGQPRQFGSVKGWDEVGQAFGLRWENDSSIAEYQDVHCYPTFPPAQGGGPIWSKQITELLEGSYCNSNGTSNNDTDDPRQAVVLYLQKELGNELRARMVRNEGGVTTSQGSPTAPQPAIVSNQAENSNSPAAQPAMRQETAPAPAPLENPKPAVSPPNTVEIEEQAVALWNQKRYSDAIPLFNQACSSGKANSCYALGLIYDFGRGVAQDFPLAATFYTKSCNAGNGGACYHLNMLQYPGLSGGMPCSRAVTLNLSRSCDMGIATSCSEVGLSYIHGCGVAKDTEKGQQLLSKGCSLGDHNACDGIK
jgi:hypothetical protein